MTRDMTMEELRDEFYLTGNKILDLVMELDEVLNEKPTEANID